MFLKKTGLMHSFIHIYLYQMDVEDPLMPAVYTYLYQRDVEDPSMAPGYFATGLLNNKAHRAVAACCL